MLSRQEELQEFKKINLTVILASFGWEIDKKKSTRASVAMTRGAGEKVIVTEKKGVQVFFSVHGDAQGTAIDYVQQIEKPGASLGEVRRALRPFLSGGYVSDLRRQHAENTVKEIKERTPEFGELRDRFERLDVVTGYHDYLCRERGIPAELLFSDRLRGLIRSDPKYGSACFPHYTIDEATNDRILSGWEIKGQLSLFCSGGVRGLFVSRGSRADEILGIGEASVDVLSYASLKGWGKTRVASLAGKISGAQHKLVMAAIDRMEQGTVLSICDRDAAGDEATRELENLFREVRRNDLTFGDDRPLKEGLDWNDVLRREQQRERDLAPEQGLGI